MRPRSNSNSYSRIYRVVRRIPRGRVATYGQVASLAGLGGHARQVGYALRHLPDGKSVPWYRVIQVSGTIAFEKGSDKFDEQCNRLIGEGVVILEGRVDMRKYRWQPDLDEFLWKPRDAWDEE